MEKWRLILDPKRSGAENMAVDEAILSEFDSGATTTPTLRLYGWEVPTISIGYLQHSAPLKGYGLPVVRRITGGRAVLHDNEITYSVVASIEHPLFAKGILEAYSAISNCIIAALKEVGIEADLSKGTARQKGSERDACFHTPSRYEVLVGGRKLVGSSQRRFKKAFLQHGSIICGLDKELNSRIFGDDVIKRMAWIEDFVSIGMEDFREILIQKFSEGFGAEFSCLPLSEAEDRFSARLIEEKYNKTEWISICGKGFDERTPVSR